MKPYVKVTIEENDGETSMTKELIWYKMKEDKTFPNPANVAIGLLESEYFDAYNSRYKDLS